MSESNDNGNGLVIVLLTAIFCVLLFGREVVLSNLQTGFWIVGGLGIAFVVLWIAWAIFKAFFIEVPRQLISEIKAERANGSSALGSIAGSVVGLSAIVFGIGFAVIALQGGNVRPYLIYAGYIYFVAMGIFLAVVALLWLSRNFRSVPQIIATVFVKWGHIAVAPVVAPIQRARTLRDYPGKWTIGDRLYAGYDVAWTMVLSILAWLFFVALPLVFFGEWAMTFFKRL